MNSTTLDRNVGYVSWILGQTSALLGVILVVMWGFDLVILRAQELYAQSSGVEFTGGEAWHPPLGPALLGLGIALAGWLAAHVRGTRIPTPVIVGAAVNVLALMLAMLALAY